MKTKQTLLCGLIAAALSLIFTACLSTSRGARVHTHQWGKWIQVSGDDATEERVCKTDSAHRQTRLTGTDRFTFEEIGETAYRVRKGTLTTGEITIPAYYRPDANSEYLPVTEIGRDSDISPPSGAFYSTSLTSIIIPDTITSIGSSAFYDCTNLTSITIPVGITTIGIAAFLNCESLTSLTLPAGVTSIALLTFSACSSLTNITIPASVTSIDSKAFSHCISLTRITVDRNNPYYTSDGRILYNKAKTELIAFPSASGKVTIPAGVTTISYGAFSVCTSLTSITFPASVTSIEGDNYLLSHSGAFAGCDSLISVIFAESSQLETIGNGTFSGCKNLTNITIPASVRSIGEWAFDDCASLTNIIIPSSVRSVGIMAFHDTAWLNSQPDGLVYAGKVLYTYKGTMPDNTVITNIRDDTIAIADGALSHWSLTNITIPSSVASIGRDAFRECFDLASIIIPPSVTSIGDGAFYSCDNLTVTISRKTTIGKDAFPDGVTLIYSD
ncbi:MAG: leucine-rich repeat domain-containing protein [Treponema sp.]|nr:leucine-rich repeat domain-containing protein [Treponema sp.]